MAQAAHDKGVRQMNVTSDAVTALLTRPETRIDGREKVTGRLRYTADITRPGTLWAAFSTSPYAHARIVAIDTRAARESGGSR